MSSASRIDDAADDDCPVCLERLEPYTFRGTERHRILCCGKFICPSCAVGMQDHQREATERCRSDPSPQSLKQLEQSFACPLCRTRIPSTPGESFRMALNNAKKGHAWAEYAVGTKYESGNGVPGGVSMSEARRWFEKAAIQGHSWAMSSYGVRLQEDLKDFAGAKKWYEKSIHADRFPKALVHLGALLHDGVGGIRKDPKEAFRLFQLAADQGYDCGQCWVGDCYEMGPDGGGVPNRDMEKSLYWRLKAAEQGENCTAMNNVGASLFTIAMEKYGTIERVGKSPVPQAIFWYRKGAALGDPTCQNMVAQL